MTGAEIGTWIGTFFSLAGAAIAIWQSRRASNAAASAKEMRNEITAKYEHTELTGLDGFLASARKAMDKYGPGVGATARRGTSPNRDAATVRAFTAELARHREMLIRKLGPESEEVCIRLNNLLVQFGSATSGQDQLDNGKQIYLEITTFSGNLKRAIDQGVYGE